MLLGRVVGTLVACVVYEGMSGVPLLLVQPLDKHGKSAGKCIVCCDATRQAGPGELVSYEGGREAALALDTTFVPVDHTIVAIVDQVHLAEGEGARP
jgi:ethanolamine utilization protein EutN